MRVKIGDYKNWVGPYQIAEKILFWKDKYEDRSVHEFGERLAKIEWLVKLCQWIDSKKKRTIKVKIHDYDVWSADSTLAYIIHPVLVKLKETKHGSPFIDDEDVPESLRSTAVAAVEEGHTDDNFHKRWDYVLDEMIFAFENVNKDWEDEFYSGEPDVKFVKTGETMFNPITNKEEETSELVRGPKDTFKVDYEGMKKVEDRMQNGFRLFGKYYRALWD